MKVSKLVVTLPLSTACVGLVMWLSAGVSLGQRSSDSAQESRDGAAATVITVRPRLGATGEALQLPGSLEPYEVARLEPKVTGFLEKVLVDIGDEVEQNALLAKLSIPEMEPEIQIAAAEIEAAEARLEKAEAGAELASVTHRRVADLHTSEPGAISKQDVDVAAAQEKVARGTARVARSELRLAKSKVARLEAIMSYAMIRAPFDGKITKRFAHTGALMSGGDPENRAIVEVVRTDRLRLAVEIPEVAVPHVRKGTAVQIVVDALPGESFTGKVARLSGALDPRTRNRRIEIDLYTRDGKLLPGMYATVYMDVRSFDNSVTIPATAIYKVDGRSCVYTVDDGRLARTPVAVLMDNGKEVVVSGKLDAETPVVVSMPRLVKAGDRVQSRLRGAVAQ